MTKKGTYTITAFGPCSNQSQMVAKPTCGSVTSGVNFTFAAYTLTITYAIDCYDFGNGNRPYTWFGKATDTPIFPAFRQLDPVSTQCVQPGNYVYKVWEDDCFAGSVTPITVGCSNQSVGVQLESKTYSANIYVSSCTELGLDGVSVTVSGEAGSGGGTTDGDGNVTISGLKQGCYYDIQLAKDKWQPITYANRYMNCYDDNHRLIMNPAVGYTCFGLCCRYPAKLSIEDEQGIHPVTLGGVGEPGGGGFTDCISVTKPAYPQAADFGVFGILCRPEGAESEMGIVYKYRVVCQYADPSGQWTVQRFTPGCAVSTIDSLTYHFAASYCDAGGTPRASSGTTAYLSDGGTKPSPSPSCGPLELTFEDGLGLGPFTLRSD